jgi:hypothetical protein
MKSVQNTQSLYFTSVKTGILNKTTHNTAFGYKVHLIQTRIKTTSIYIQFAEGTTTTWGQDSTVGIVTCYGLDSLGIKSQWGPDFCTDTD